MHHAIENKKETNPNPHYFPKKKKHKNPDFKQVRKS